MKNVTVCIFWFQFYIFLDSANTVMPVNLEYKGVTVKFHFEHFHLVTCMQFELKFNVLPLLPQVT